jgi:hypothetical protein
MEPSNASRAGIIHRFLSTIPGLHLSLGLPADVTVSPFAGAEEKPVFDFRGRG